MLEALNFSMIRSNQLVSLGKNIQNMFIDFDFENDTYALGSFVRKYRTAYQDYGKAYERDLRDPFTIAIKEKNTARGKAFKGLKNFIISYTNSDELPISEAADRLLRVIERHGWRASSMGYLNQSAAIIKMITEINDLHLADIALIGATNWFNKLVSTQTAFEVTQSEKASQPPSPLPTVTETRPELENAIRILISMIDNHYNENKTDAQLAGYVMSINEYITSIMAIARAAETREENEEDDAAPAV